MSFWKNLFGAGPKSPPSDPQGAPEPAGAPRTAGASYVESVFDFNLADQPETENWRAIYGLRDIPDLFYAQKIDQAERQLREALAQYPEYAFVPSWLGTVLEAKGEIEQARRAYAEGIPVANVKHGLCGDLALLEFKHGAAAEAVRWWIRSILLQLPGKSVQEAKSFLYLAHVARCLGEADASAKLMQASAKGPQGAIDLGPQAKENLSKKVKAAQKPEMAAAIRELTAKRWTGF